MDGDTVNGAAKCTYSGGGKRNGSVQVSTVLFRKRAGRGRIHDESDGGQPAPCEVQPPPRDGHQRLRQQYRGPAKFGHGRTIWSRWDEGDGVTWMFDGKQVPGANVSTKFDMGGKPICTFVGDDHRGNVYAHGSACI